MPDWKHYKTSRQVRVELPGGYSVLMRQPNLRRVLAESPLEPSLLARYTTQRAAGSIPDKPVPLDTAAALHQRRRAAEEIELSKAHYADYMDLTYAVLCECTIEPQLFMDEQEAEAQAGVWIYDIAPGDLALLEQAAWGLLKLEPAEAREIAPFCEPAVPGAEGAAVGPAAEPAAAEPAAAPAGPAGGAGTGAV
jgi:hypothetical protein